MPTRTEGDMAHEHEDRIRKRAYEIWEREGCPNGRDQEHWHQASREIENEQSGNWTGTDDLVGGSIAAARLPRALEADADKPAGDLQPGSTSLAGGPGTRRDTIRVDQEPTKRCTSSSTEQSQATLDKTLTSGTPLPADVSQTLPELDQTLNAVGDIVEEREPSVEEMRDLGARDGRALAEALASSVPEGITEEQADGMFQIVVGGIEDAAEKMIASGLSVTLVLAYRAACYEAIDHEMARHARGDEIPSA
jgi:Protein of unknown function (DUF2934)